MNCDATTASARRWSTSAAARVRRRRRAKGVPVYLHDWFGAGRHAQGGQHQVAKSCKADGRRVIAQMPPLTGDESRVAEVARRRLPAAARPGRRPAADHGHHACQPQGQTMLVRGTTADNGTVKRWRSTAGRPVWRRRTSRSGRSSSIDAAGAAFRPRRRRRRQHRDHGARGCPRLHRPRKKVQPCRDHLGRKGRQTPGAAWTRRQGHQRGTRH